MKKILLLAFILLSLEGCKKDKDPAPDLATKASGSFIASKFIYAGMNIPLVNGTEMIIVFQKAGAETVTGVMRYKVEGEAQPEESLGTLTVKDAGQSGVDLYEGSTRVGNVSNENQLVLSGDAGGLFFEITAKKQ